MGPASICDRAGTVSACGTGVPGTAPYSYTGRVVVAVALVALAVLLWQLNGVVIVVFGSIVVAAALRALAMPLHERLHLPERAALFAVVALLLLFVVAGGWFAGDRIAEQLTELRQTLPRALESLTAWLQRSAVGRSVLELWDNAKSDGLPLTHVASIATMTLGAISSALLIVVAGIYFAADPTLYRRGIAHLLPEQQRKRVDDALRAAGDALSRWLLGQAVSMLAIGLLTWLGLLLIGMPLALTLGIITGALAFVPFFGAITAGLLVVLLAFTQGPQMALSAALLFVALQQVEEFLILPFVQRWAVRLPPVLGLVAVLIFSVLFGPLGALFATPLMVVVMVLVQKLYVKGVTESPVAEMKAVPRDGRAERPAALADQRSVRR